VLSPLPPVSCHQVYCLQVLAGLAQHRGFSFQLDQLQVPQLVVEKMRSFANQRSVQVSPCETFARKVVGTDKEHSAFGCQLYGFKAVAGLARDPATCATLEGLGMCDWLIQSMERFWGEINVQLEGVRALAKMAGMSCTSNNAPDGHKTLEGHLLYPLQRPAHFLVSSWGGSGRAT
jgi:hypothetical protein